MDRIYIGLYTIATIEEKCECRVMKMKAIVFRYTWVYSKEDTMAHTHGPVVSS